MFDVFNKVVDFFRKSVENGWIKDFLAWHGWGIVIFSIFRLVFLEAKQILNLNYTLFFLLLSGFLQE